MTHWEIIIKRGVLLIVVLFFFPSMKHHQQSAFAIISVLYLDHLCMIMTPWVVLAIQGHTKGPHRESFSPANRWLHSTRPDNHRQLVTFIHIQLFTISPYPEQTHTWKHTGARFTFSAHLPAQTSQACTQSLIRGKMLLQQDCNQRAISTTTQSFSGLCPTECFS